uniref:Uncharacterized protein n=1 Tax=Zea mays TaxID=4577 RepID=C4J7Q5_MAIZE|nr:unknown [Zea mays]ACR37206.1 unknown [Zea mays]
MASGFGRATIRSCSADLRDAAVLAWSRMRACSLRSVMAVCFLTR